MSAEPNRDEILLHAAHNNGDALLFLRAYARRAHWVDDLCDRDKLDAGEHYEAGQLAGMEIEWLLAISGNPFFLANKTALVPAMVIAANAWADSEQSSLKNSTVGDVVKGQWHEVVYLTALLTGGWGWLRQTSSKFRAYDLEERQTSNQEETNGLLRK
jgi:hypothetical protein